MKTAKKSSAKSVLKFIIILILVLAIIAVGICFNRIRTVSSLHKIGGDLYAAEYYNDYKLDKAMEEGAGSIVEMVNFVSRNILFGYPVDLSEDSFACSAFLATTEDGDSIVGRNFDYPLSPSVVLHCTPDNGYESTVCFPPISLTCPQRMT